MARFTGATDQQNEPPSDLNRNIVYNDAYLLGASDQRDCEKWRTPAGSVGVRTCAGRVKVLAGFQWGLLCTNQRNQQYWST